MYTLCLKHIAYSLLILVSETWLEFFLWFQWVLNQTHYHIPLFLYTTTWYTFVVFVNMELHLFPLLILFNYYLYNLAVLKCVWMLWFCFRRVLSVWLYEKEEPYLYILFYLPLSFCHCLVSYFYILWVWEEWSAGNAPDLGSLSSFLVCRSPI